MRGKEINFCTILGKMGITPAYAGKRLWFLQKRWCSWDHPRVCGEKYNAVDMQADYLGSPPRMRGKGPASRRFPARAEDHPRVCGEKAQTAQQTETQKGSPPRMRGKVAGVARRPQTAGITPAYAGKRCVRCRRSPRGRDHPRVCGEKSRCFMRWPTRRGSPPRMRGKGHPMHPGPAYTGITPAYAGKSWRVEIRSRSVWDHPRVCGEKFDEITDDGDLPGSPPRMRGKDLQRPRQHRGTGITPAYAGKR